MLVKYDWREDPTMNLELIEIITYTCAGLGGVLLFLCIILASFIIYGFCKRYCSKQTQRYSVVPLTRDPVDIETAVLQRFQVNNDAAKGLSGLGLIDEVDGIQKDSIKNEAPIKRKLFWKKKKEIQRKVSVEDTRFSDEELNAGKPKHFFKKKRQAASIGVRKLFGLFCERLNGR